MHLERSSTESSLSSLQPERKNKQKKLRTSLQVDEGLIQAREYGCASCCVRPCDVVRAKKALEGSKTAVCTVIGFPHGTATTANKVAEAKEAMSNGCTELDMVVNNGAAIGGEWDAVKADI